MDFLSLIVTLIASSLFIVVSGFLLLQKPRTLAVLFLIIICIALGVGNAFVPLISLTDSLAEASSYAYISSMLFTIGLVTIPFEVIIFQSDSRLIASRVRRRIFLMAYFVVTLITALFCVFLPGAEMLAEGSYWFGTATKIWIFVLMLSMIPISLCIDVISYWRSEEQENVLSIMSLALILFASIASLAYALGGYPDDWILISIGFIFTIGVLASLFWANRIDFVRPAPEAFSTSSKSTFRLLKGRVYVIEEERPNMSFEIFSEILRSRCYDCNNDESFECERLDCSTCSLPCPCRECTLYRSRTQGLVITRRHPSEIRVNFLIQTTPVIWLSSIPGKDNLDPAKLSLLTDMIVNFVEKSENGVVLVEGIEYLATANDFQRALRAIDRWSEVVMANSSRLVMSLNPKAFDQKEIALIERNREIVRIDDKASLEKILASSSIFRKE